MSKLRKKVIDRVEYNVSVDIENIKEAIENFDEFCRKLGGRLEFSPHVGAEQAEIRLSCILPRPETIRLSVIHTRRLNAAAIHLWREEEYKEGLPPTALTFSTAAEVGIVVGRPDGNVITSTTGYATVPRLFEFEDAGVYKVNRIDLTVRLKSSSKGIKANYIEIKLS